METLLWSLHFVLAVTLVVVILLQPGQAGGMGTAFGGGGSQTVFGSQGSTGFLGKLTAVLGTLFFLTSLSLAVLSTSGDESIMEDAGPGGAQQQEQAPTPPGQGQGRDLEVPSVPDEAPAPDTPPQP